MEKGLIDGCLGIFSTWNSKCISLVALLRLFRNWSPRFAKSIVMFLCLVLDHFHFLNLPQSIKDMIEISLIFSFFQKYIKFIISPEIATTKILIILCMNKVHNIVIFYALLVWLHLKLVVKHQSKYSLWNVLIYYLESTCTWEFYYTLRSLLLALLMWSYLISLLDHLVRVLYLWILYKVLYQHSCV